MRYQGKTQQRTRTIPCSIQDSCCCCGLVRAFARSFGISFADLSIDWSLGSSMKDTIDTIACIVGKKWRFAPIHRALPGSFSCDSRQYSSSHHSQTQGHVSRVRAGRRREEKRREGTKKRGKKR